MEHWHVLQYGWTPKRCQVKEVSYERPYTVEFHLDETLGESTLQRQEGDWLPGARRRWNKE